MSDARFGSSSVSRAAGSAPPPRLARGFIDIRRTANPVRRRVRPRGVPPALAEHELFCTDDAGEGAELLGKVLSATTLRPRGGGRIEVAVHGVQLREVSMLYVDVTTSATLEMPATGPYFAVHMPTSGRLPCRIDDRTVEADPLHALVTGPGAAVEMEVDADCPQLVIRIEQGALERHLTRMLGASLTQPVVFEPVMDLTGEAAMRWSSAMQLVHTEVYYPSSLLQRGHGIGPLEELVMSTLLLLQPSSYRAQLTVPAQAPGRRVVREAMDYIEAHLRDRLGVADIARGVHMSVRAVQKGFRDELGTTPMLYLRDRRLERVRAELADALPSDGVTVTEVAQRWGFHHLGGFAVLYRKRWGESPSATLRR